jgi:phage protein U
MLGLVEAGDDSIRKEAALYPNTSGQQNILASLKAQASKRVL